MIFFGHLGLTVGGYKLYEKILPNQSAAGPAAVDYRLVLLGSILPDLLDKPIGAVLFVDTYHNSRIYGHTLLFSLLLILAGYIVYKRRGARSVLTVGFASLVHLILDGMWQEPETILWPFLNIKDALSANKDWLHELLAFPYKFDNWMASRFEEFMRDLSPVLFELVGLGILIFFLIRLIRACKVNAFIKNGRL